MHAAEAFAPSAAGAKTILTVAFPYAPVGPRAVGGAEEVCSQVEACTAAVGFRSVVVAHAASRPAGVLYGTQVPDGPLTDDVRAAVEAAQQSQIERACREHQVALVHMHGLDFHRYRIPEALPVVVTLHLPPGWYPETIWDLPERYHLVCVSASQRRACPAHARSRVRVVANGIPLPDRATLRATGKYALMMARICPEKNLQVGLDAARRVGMPVILAGEVFPYPAHQRYFEAEITPRLSSVPEAHAPRTAASSQEPGVARFIGAVSGDDKQRLLSRAACLLTPSLAEETSSLVSMEALAAGVPVIGMRVGAMPEVVDEGRTGFLITPGEGSTERLAEALRRVDRVDRGACRAAAEERFPLHRMTDAYLTLYDSLALAVGDEPPSDEDGFPKRLTAKTELLTALVFDEGEWRALVPGWLALWNRDPQATPFQHPAWLMAWWKQFGGDGELAAVAVRREPGGELDGLLPTYVYREPETDERTLLLMGAGTTDYLDGIWDGYTGNAATCAIEALLGRSAASGDAAALWDRAALMQLREESPLLRAWKAAGMATGDAEPCSVIPMQRELPAKIRLNVRRYRRRAAARGELTFEVCGCVQEALEAFEQLVLLHGRRWEGRGEEGVLHDPRVLAHHREAIPELLSAGLLRMFRLWIGSEVLGVLYGMASPAHVKERSLFLYLVGFEERFADLSPGTLLLGGAWEYARAQGFGWIDLLRGGEAYKQLWGAETRATLVAEG